MDKQKLNNMQPTAKLEAWIEQAENGNIETMEAQILQLLKKHHFLTVFEISQATGITGRIR